MTSTPLIYRKRRTFLVVEELRILEGYISITIPRWKEHHMVVLYTRLLSRDILDTIKVGTYLIATVNTEAELAEQLFFEDIVLAQTLEDQQKVGGNYGGTI